MPLRAFWTKDRSPMSKAAIPVGMALLSIGLMLLLTGLSWPRFAFAAHMDPETSDVIRWTLLGLSVGLECGGLVIALSAALRKADPPL
jgi:hypothetical protein